MSGPGVYDVWSARGVCLGLGCMMCEVHVECVFGLCWVGLCRRRKHAHTHIFNADVIHSMPECGVLPRVVLHC